MRRSGIAAVCIIACLLVVGGRTWAGPKWEIGDDGWMKLSFLGQVHGAVTDGAADEEDVYVRRGRIILAGQITDGVKFFMETDNDNAGKNGAAFSSTDIQDVFVDVQIMGSAHWVKAGLLLLPLSFENHSSAASLLGIDYNAETIKFVNTFVWRDLGAELHGNFGDRVSYMLGTYDGFDSPTGIKNSGAPLRYVGHVAINLLGKAQSGWFYTQDRQGKEQYLSLGVGVDGQDDATLDLSVSNAVPQDSSAWVVDLQSGFKLSETISLTLNGAYYEWDNAAFKGNTAFAEAGLMMKKVMLTAKYSLQSPDEGGDTQDQTVGLHYFTKGHNMRAGVEQRFGDSADQTLVGVQFLL